MEENKVNYSKLGKKLAKKVATSGDNNHYQVAYAIHAKNELEKTHIHLIINSIDIDTYKKRRVLNKDIVQIQSDLNEIVLDYIENDINS